MLYTFEPCANQKDLSKLLFNFLRLDREEFSKLNIQLLIELTNYYHTKNLELLRNYLRKEQKNANNTKSND